LLEKLDRPYGLIKRETVPGTERTNWNAQYDEVCNKMSERVYLINRHKRIMNQHWLHLITSALLLSVLDYCFTAWGNLSNSKYDRIDSILFRAVKVILPTKSNTKKNKLILFERLNWLSAAERYELYMLKFIHKNIVSKTSLTNSLSEFFVKMPESDRNLRSKECFVVPRMRTEYGKDSFYYQAIQVWNCLPYEIKTCQSSKLFENQIREILLKCRNDDIVYYENNRVINTVSC
jgi:hypothetical protein